MKFDTSDFLVKPGSKVKLKEMDTRFSAGLNKKKGQKELLKNISELAEFQEKFWADNRYSLLII
jgi:YesN/AraC family two-component response regulator